MSEHLEADDSPAITKHLSTRRIKPRIVYSLLLGASLAGIWIAHQNDGLVTRFVWWGIVVATGHLAGGLYWRLVLFETDAFVDDKSLRAVRARWHRIETTIVWVLFCCGIVGFGAGVWRLSPGLDTGVFFLASLCTPLVWFAIVHRRRRNLDDHLGVFRWILLAITLAALSGFAWIDTGTGIVQWLVRVGHVGAFALWVGGVTWHNFVILPTVDSRPNSEDALKAQVRRFRRHLPVGIVLILVTGLYQATQLVGISPGSLTETTSGILVLGKFLVLTALTGLVLVTLQRPRG